MRIRIFGGFERGAQGRSPTTEQAPGDGNREWRLMISEKTDPAWNLSVEEALLDACAKGTSPSTLRIWVNSPSVILGAFQDPALEIDMALCRDLEIPVMRRFTGGGAVYHDLGNVNWSVIAGADREILFREGLLHAFTRYSEGLIRTLIGLGMKGRFVGPNSIYVNGGKISGLAGYVRRGCILCHGTLLISTDLDRLVKVLTPSREIAKEGGAIFTRSAKAPITSVEKELKRNLRVADVIPRLVEGFQSALDLRLQRGGISSLELQHSETLLREKYRLPEWNLGGFGRIR